MMENTATKAALNKDKSYLVMERQLKRVHVVIRKMQTLVPGAHELDKFNAYSHCVSWLHGLRSLYEVDREACVGAAVSSVEPCDQDEQDDEGSASDQDKITDDVGTIDDISE